MSDVKPSQLVLIDGSSYFYRAFHALPPLTNSKGEPTGAVYGVINMIRKLIKDEAPEACAVIFDAKGKTFRDDLFPQYKANRPPMPDELASQFQPLIDVIDALGIPRLTIPKVEADDVIATLARQAETRGMHTLISTGDKDLAQLVNDKTTLINTMSDHRLDIGGVVEKFGVGPDLIIDYLTLIGDKVDNVPGVEKVGPKTACKWLKQYGNLENIMQHADEVGGKVGENLRTALPQLPLSKQLVTVKYDVDLPYTIDDLTQRPIDKPALIELLKQLEFKQWLREYLDDASGQQKEKTYATVLTDNDWQTWLKQIKSAKTFAFDTETTSLDTINADLVGISLAIEPDKAAYVPLAHDYDGAPTQLDRDKVLNDLKPLLTSSPGRLIGQNLKYDISILAQYGIQIDSIADDTMLASYVINSGGSRHDMDTLALKYLGCKTISYEEVAGKGKSQKTFNEIPIEEASTYAAEDADITLQLQHVLKPKIEAEKGLSFIYEKIELPLVPVLARMEQKGVLIDAELLIAQSAELSTALEKLAGEAYELAGETFNLASPKQLQQILFEKMGLPVLQKTPKGQPSTAEGVLHDLAHDYPIVNIILKHRSYSKLKSTYTDRLPEQIHPKTGRVHTSFNQAVTATGRLSSTNPNLQNIPARSEEGRRIRKAFIAPTDYLILAADYSQVELRIMANLSNDKGLLNAFANGHDIHAATASEVFDVPLDEVTHDQRSHAKAVNFGLIYGMSAFGLSRQLDITRQEADRYIKVYFDRYPGVKAYMENARKTAHDKGYVETLFGRRLYLPEIQSRNHARVKAAERAAINAPMQGTAADLIKMAMIEVDHALTAHKLRSKLILQVHDELILEVHIDELDTVKKLVDTHMTDVAKLKVPIQVSIGVADNWEEAH